MEVPEVSLIINPTDSRPVTCWVLEDFNRTGEIHFSPGTAADMLLLKWWVDFIGNAAADEYFERYKEDEARDDKIDGTSAVNSDEVPF